MGVSKNNGTPKSSILIGFSIINHPFWGTPIFGNIHINLKAKLQTTHSFFQTFHLQAAKITLEVGKKVLHAVDGKIWLTSWLC